MLIYQAAGHSLMTTRASAFCSSTPSPPPPPPPPPSRSLQRTTAISSLSSSSLDEFDVLLASSTAAAPPALDEARWSLLERFSRITRFYRNFFEYVPFYSSSATHEKLAAPSQDVFQEFEPARRYLETVGRSSQAAATSSSESCKDLYNRRKRPSIIVDKRTGIWEETVQAVTQVGTFEILSVRSPVPSNQVSTITHKYSLFPFLD